MFIRSARLAADGKPVVQGVGATRDGNTVRVDVLHAAAPIRKGKLQVSLHARNHNERVTVQVPERVKPGAYERVTLEVTE